MKIFGKTDIGRVREMNQDCYSAGEHESGMVWAVVCDGMGGPAGGNIASSTAAKVISNTLTSKYKKNMGRRAVKNMLISAINSANVNVFDISSSNSELNGMGTTVVVAVISGGTLQIAHVGDSRAYIIGKNGMRQITTDHSLVQQMIDTGQLTQTEAKNYPLRNVITRAVGIKETVEADYNELSFEKGDILLICTDGLTNNVSDEEILSIVQNSPNGCFVDSLIECANNNGGSDNITAVGIAD